MSFELELNLVLGPMFIGTLISVSLTGVILLQCASYFQHFQHEPLWMKAMVAYLLIADFVHAGVVSATTYQYLITFFGSLTTLGRFTPLLASIPALTVSVSCVVQGFFTWRIISLTNYRPLAWFLCVLIFIEFGSGIAVTIAYIYHTFLLIGPYPISVVFIPWLTSSALCDILITFSLCWYLQTNRSGHSTSPTDFFVSKLIHMTVQTGFITTLWALLDLIAFVVEDSTTLYILFTFPLAKIYTFSLMSTLNARHKWTVANERAADPGPGAWHVRDGTVNIPESSSLAWRRQMRALDAESVKSDTPDHAQEESAPP